MWIKDISFRPNKSTTTDTVFKTLNSVYFDERDDNINDEYEDIEMIIRGAHSESRLFFDPSTAKSIHEETPFKESVALAMESSDPYMDFRVSMEEMVGANGNMTKDWVYLEELLGWYLRSNAKHNHAYIVAAFVDLLVNISSLSAPPLYSDGVCQQDEDLVSTRSSSCASSGELKQLGLKSSFATTTTSCFSMSSSSSSPPSYCDQEIKSTSCVDH